MDDILTGRRLSLVIESTKDTPRAATWSRCRIDMSYQAINACVRGASTHRKKRQEVVLTGTVAGAGRSLWGAVMQLDVKDRNSRHGDKRDRFLFSVLGFALLAF